MDGYRLLVFAVTVLGMGRLGTKHVLHIAALLCNVYFIDSTREVQAIVGS